MGRHSDSHRGRKKSIRRVEKTIQEWEKHYPGTWILLEVTEEANGEPVRGKLITTAHDPEDFQRLWKLQREKGVLTMVTFGPPLEPGPAVVVCAT